MFRQRFTFSVRVFKLWAAFHALQFWEQNDSEKFIFCTQAISWIRQLYEATVESLTEVGRTAEETENLQQEHEKMEVTSKVRVMITNIVFAEIFSMDNVSVMFARRLPFTKFVSYTP